MATVKRSRSETNLLKWRAIVAYARFTSPLASFDDTRATVEEIGSKSYVKLTARSKTLAIYRVRPDGQLKRMRRPPRELRGPDDE